MITHEDDVAAPARRVVRMADGRIIPTRPGEWRRRMSACETLRTALSRSSRTGCAPA